MSSEHSLDGAQRNPGVACESVTAAPDFAVLHPDYQPRPSNHHARCLSLSVCSTWPLIDLAASEARNPASAATSVGLIIALIDCAAIASARTRRIRACWRSPRQGDAFIATSQQSIKAQRPAAGEHQIKKHEAEQDRGLAA